MAKADFERAKAEFPSTGMHDEWVQVLDEQPSIMFAILGDIYNVVRDEQDRDNGIKRIGRRPFRAASSIDELYRTVLPQQYTTELFPEALKQLIGTRSQRQFAMKVPVSQSVISRLLSGEVKPDLQLMEAIAIAAKVPPHFFVEWRAQAIGALIEHHLSDKPNLGITAVKRLRSAR